MPRATRGRDFGAQTLADRAAAGCQNLTLGAEIFHQIADTAGGKDQTGFDVGAVYDLSEHHHLLLSLWRGLQNRSATNQFSYYASMQWTF